ncbi:MAG: hypothetical protein C4530_24140 [Desulfobacteraceae bacterium]|nr:MAG: hypothetical protein C4530_24140 [Desulfobacteraceae bacterium]
MEFLRWMVINFGFFFGSVFLAYIYLIIHRLTYLFDLLRKVGIDGHDLQQSGNSLLPLGFLEPLFTRLERAVMTGSGSSDAVVDAIWSEVDGQVSTHFTALNGYINSLVLFGFAGTIFGSIGAFNKMFQGMAQGMTAETLFVGSWNNGLATALYTSLGAAAIGGSMITLLCSRYLMSRAKRLESLVALRIAEIIEEAHLSTTPKVFVGTSSHGSGEPPESSKPLWTLCDSVRTLGKG